MGEQVGEGRPVEGGIARVPVHLLGAKLRMRDPSIATLSRTRSTPNLQHRWHCTTPNSPSVAWANWRARRLITWRA